MVGTVRRCCSPVEKQVGAFGSLCTYLGGWASEELGGIAELAELAEIAGIAGTLWTSSSPFEPPNHLDGGQTGCQCACKDGEHKIFSEHK